MYFIATIFIGWVLLNLILSVVEYLLQLPAGVIKEPAGYYIFIGYIVMLFLQIKSPLTLGEKGSENPLLAMKKIEIKLFFKDVYYAIWWPYYIIRKIKN